MRFPSFATLWIVQCFAALFLAILFLQSGIDKIVDRRGNLTWLQKHFAQSPLASTVERMFLAITILETTAGVLCAVGLLLIVVAQLTVVAYCGAIVATLALACLFFGQRVAKDYAGAAVLIPYILLALFAVWVLRPDSLAAL